MSHVKATPGFHILPIVRVDALSEAWVVYAPGCTELTVDGGARVPILLPPATSLNANLISSIRCEDESRHRPTMLLACLSPYPAPRPVRHEARVIDQGWADLVAVVG